MASSRILTTLRWGIPLAIVGYLIYDVQRQAGFDQIWYGNKNWPLLGLALLFFLAAQLLTFARWYWLVRALALPFRWNDALRLGFLGYLLTFISLGTIGGDLLKAIFVAREQPGRRLEAVSTVLVDRILGLYSLVLLAIGAIFLTGAWQSPTSTTVEILFQAVFAAAVTGTLGLLVVLSLGGSRSARLRQWLGEVPLLGRVLRPLADAVQAYRRSLATVVTSIAVGLAAQALIAACVWATASSLLPDAPSAGKHMFIAPLALLTTLLPIPGYGLGVFELAIEFLYRHVGFAGPGAGLLVALGFRLVMIATAVLSAVICAASRREVSDAMREARDEYDRLAAHA